MKKELLKSNVYEAEKTLVIVGSCLENMQPEAYKQLESMSDNIFEVCLEQTHINMILSKIIGMLCRVKVEKVIFATVDKSPHCVQMHYIEGEIRKSMNIDHISMVHYVAVDNKLIEISNETIKKSKILSELEQNG